ncbi:phage tail tape measure protein [Stutzerimonas zhaodongensis]|uniref:phage tail tape measure protein n=1 Tax=Stutzerimonas zhaodongensis TaxID=1176257 RepID=UPI001F4EABAF|nr:phage tail tape measure protein [Stutzerimonas zhaodongensis]UNG19246.1 phage tail tape measure protein [Stutzerimonas zhaodongensis]
MATNSAALNFILKLTDQVSAPLGKVKMGFNELAEKGQDNIRQMGFGLAGMVGAGLAINESLQPALEMNRALGEVKSLGVAEDALQRLNDKALEFSVAYGANARDFVSSAYDIQSAIAGLTGEQLSSFTNASNLLAKATKADAGTITSYVGTMYGIFKNQADAMGKAEWVENLTGQTALAVQMFKTTGKDMSDAFTSIGASATSAGIGLSEQVAILGTLQATMGGAEAGTKYKAFLSGVGGAQEKLGLSFTDSQGRMLPMLQILDKLKGKFGDTLDVAESDALKKAFGSDEAVGLIKLLMTDTTGLANSMEQLGNVHGLEQAEKMAKAMVDPWQQFGAAVQALRIAFGQALIPLLTPLMERLTAIAGTLTRWAGLFPNITKLLGMLTLGVLGVIAAVAGLTILNGIFGMLSMLASPIALIVIGLAALVIGVGAAIYYWDDLKAAFGDTAWFQAIVVMLTPVVMLFRVFGALLNVLWVGLQQVVAFGMQMVDWLASLEVVTTAAKAIWDVFIWGLTNLSPFALLGSALKGLIALLNKIPGINIDTTFGDMPAVPSVPGGEVVMTAAEQADRAQKAQATINNAIPSLSPQRATAVPPGGLLTSIQNTSNQDKGTRVEKVEIHTGKAMSPLELENMMSMAVGG